MSFEVGGRDDGDGGDDDFDIDVEDETDDEDDENVVSAHVHVNPPGPISKFLTAVFGKFCIRYLPFLTQKCRFGVRHWAWTKLCMCGYGLLVQPEEDGGWHGGVCDLKTGIELQPCAHCYAGMSPGHHQWALSVEEEHLVDAWRIYRSQLLNEIEGSTYGYSISVKLNGGAETFLMSRNEGAPDLSSSRGLLSSSPRLTKSKSDKPN